MEHRDGEEVVAPELVVAEIGEMVAGGAGPGGIGAGGPASVEWAVFGKLSTRSSSHLVTSYHLTSKTGGSFPRCILRCAIFQKSILAALGCKGKKGHSTEGNLLTVFSYREPPRLREPVVLSKRAQEPRRHGTR